MMTLYRRDFGEPEAATPAPRAASDVQEDGTGLRNDGFRGTLISAWLIAALVAAVVLLLPSTAIGPAGYAIGPSVGQAPSGHLYRAIGEMPACSDLDYAYQRC